MLNSTTLEVAIGLALIFLLLSLLCTAINETIAGFFGTRAAMLEEGIRSLFSNGEIQVTDKDGTTKAAISDLIYGHGLVQGLYRTKVGQTVAQSLKDKQLPSYIPTRTFASALMDVLFPQAGKTTTLDSMLTDLQKLPDGAAKEALVTLVKQSDGDLQKTRKAIEAWYDDSMDRVSGWYKRKSQFMLLGIGLAMALILNIDSIHVARTLWSTPAFRSYAVTTAMAYGSPASSDSTRQTPQQINQQLTALESVGLPLGWHDPYFPWKLATSNSEAVWLTLTSIAGWILTAIAVSLGAPFWFDLLNQFMVIRSTIKPSEKSGTEGSKDPAAGS